MSAKVTVIGLDSADSELIKKWSSEGYLTNFRQLLSSTGYADINSRVAYGEALSSYECCTTEVLWTSLLTGCRPHKTGYWSITDYSPSDYKISSPLTNCSYDFEEYPLFYELGDQYRTAVMNIPSSTITETNNGLQLLGWSGHYPGVSQQSNPPEFLNKVIEKYGDNPVLFKDDGIWWDDKYISWVRKAIAESVRSQAHLYQEVLANESWDLFFCAFSELHTAGHDLYAHSQTDHPLSQHLNRGGDKLSNPLREAYQSVDQAIGQIMNDVPNDSYVLVFSPHGIGPNFSDLPSYLFLPEFLYRYSFPGMAAIPGDSLDIPGPVLTQPFRNGWTTETWTSIPESNPLKTCMKRLLPRQLLTTGCCGLRSPFSAQAQEIDQSWMPTMWYQPLWPRMKAFALPGFANGHIRINLKGREKHGIVAKTDYEAVCTDIKHALTHLTDARTGMPIVKDVVPTRRRFTDDDSKLPDADLIVYWNNQTTDVVESPEFGRIGPVTYPRTGTHRKTGFVMIQGPGITPGSHLPMADVVDLAPTVLSLMDVDLPAHFDGRSLINLCFT